MASKTPGGGGGFGRGSSGSGGGGRGGKPKKPKVTKEDAMKKHPAGKGLPNQGAKAKVYDFRTGQEVKPSAPVKRTLASDTKRVIKSPKTKVAGASVGTAVAAAGTIKGMKKAGEANAARIRRNKAKSVPVPRNPRKQ
jgi:hypothetical protein